MIEPQNTTMPLPAAPAQTEAPDRDGVGFGEMLAESMGMVSAIDPDFVQRILPNNQEGRQFGEDAAEFPASGTDVARVGDGETNPGREDGAPLSAETVVRTIPAIPVALSTPTPITGGSGTVDPVPVVAVDRDLLPTRMLPTPVAPVAMIETVVPVDGIGVPILTSAPDIVSPASDQTQPSPATAAPVDSIGVPILTGDPETGASMDPHNERTGGAPLVQEQATPSTAPLAGESRQPITPADPGLPPQPIPMAETTVTTDAAPSRVATDPTRSINPGLLRPEPTRPDPIRPDPSPPDPVRPEPTRPGQDRSIPVGPTPAGAAETTQPNTVGTAASPRIDLGNESPIQISDAKTAVTGVGRAPEPVTVEVASSPVSVSSNVASVEATPAQPVAAAVSEPNAPVLHSALAARIMRAVEMQANQPPPRTMVVDIPEIEGLRLVVSVRAGAEVHVVPTSGSTTPEAFRPLMDELSGVLANRGFVMTGDGRERGDDPRQQDQQEQVPFHMQRPTFQRQAPSDNDLRI